MTKGQKNPRGQATFVLGAEYVELLDQIAKETMMNKTAIMRAFVNLAAMKVGLEPVGKVPKFLAPVS